MIFVSEYRDDLENQREGDAGMYAGIAFMHVVLFADEFACKYCIAFCNAYEIQTGGKIDGADHYRIPGNDCCTLHSFAVEINDLHKGAGGVVGADNIYRLIRGIRINTCNGC